MQIPINPDARPAVRTLLLAVAVSVVLWFIPFADIVTYPFRLFVTFIHEGGHALATILTGGEVRGLQVSPDGSGLVYSAGGGRLAGLLVASAGYLGAMAYGAGLLVLVRRAVAARATLFVTAAYVLALAILFGWRNAFTVAAGTLIALGLAAVARWAAPKVASFLVGFLAVQCIVAALLDLRTLLFLSRPFGPDVHTDAENMARYTGIPAIIWALLWTALALAILVAALRAYVGARQTRRLSRRVLTDRLEIR